MHETERARRFATVAEVEVVRCITARSVRSSWRGGSDTNRVQGFVSCEAMRLMSDVFAKTPLWSKFP